ncbi:hypothetical protein C8035_v006714 [Colletotrichum spinosum]|uniref:Uncharacterized protein n=3 Tax=Colletotrichum orbiculare species complex TaxID=2707354 RepID=A0A4R8RK51_COLTR|nr:hypothetical protein C8035_v006714 [Colletotrichum spinosum]TDZ54783.1 hypothetical protein CTRI78_v006030 [Colletotrichum trifolii]
MSLAAAAHRSYTKVCVGCFSPYVTVTILEAVVMADRDWRISLRDCKSAALRFDMQPPQANRVIYFRTRSLSCSPSWNRVQSAANFAFAV